MNWIVLLLCAYGVCFGLQHKVPFLHRVSFMTKMLSCTYCTGFHAGWITYLIFNCLEYLQFNTMDFHYSELFAISFSSAIYCYMIDVFVQYFER